MILSSVICATMASTPIGGHVTIPLDRYVATVSPDSRTLSSDARTLRWSRAYSDLADLDGYIDDESSADLVLIEPSVLSRASSFLKAAERQLSTAPVVFMDGAEEVGFRWNRADGFASVSFVDDGNIVVFVRAPGSDEAYRLDQPYDPAVIATVVQQLQAIA